MEKYDFLTDMVWQCTFYSFGIGVFLYFNFFYDYLKVLQCFKKKIDNFWQMSVEIRFFENVWKTCFFTILVEKVTFFTFHDLAIR